MFEFLRHRWAQASVLILLVALFVVPAESQVGIVRGRNEEPLPNGDVIETVVLKWTNRDTANSEGANSAGADTIIGADRDTSQWFTLWGADEMQVTVRTTSVNAMDSFIVWFEGSPNGDSVGNDTPRRIYQTGTAGQDTFVRIIPATVDSMAVGRLHVQQKGGAATDTMKIDRMTVRLLWKRR